jgi:hypothetical protein
MVLENKSATYQTKVVMQKALKTATSVKFLFTKSDNLNMNFNMIILTLGIPDVFPRVLTIRCQ